MAAAMSASVSYAADDPALDEALASRAMACAACHLGGAAGAGQPVPLIAGQQAAYLYLQMRDFQTGSRANALMAAAVKDLDRKQMTALARHFAAQAWTGAEAEEAPAAEIRQRAKAGISAGECTQCHQGGFVGASRVPRLAGQRYDYLRSTLHAFKHGERTNAPSMASLIKQYDDADLDAMAHYLAALGTEGDGAETVTR